MSSRLDRAIEDLDLQDWLSDYSDVKMSGNELRIKECPICGNEKYKLYVNVSKPAWNCKVCDWGRGLGDVVVLMSGISGRSPTDIRLELMSFVPPAPSGDITSMLLTAFDGTEDEEIQGIDFEEIEVPGEPKFDGLTTRKVLEYAYERGLTEDDVKRLCLRASGGLQTSKGREIRGPFLVFPITLGDKFVSWQGRRLINQEPKYVSYANIKNWLYPLNQEFFKHYKGTVYLVEGVFDALGMLRLGIPALCTFGTSISAKQMNLLIELRPKTVCFAWDLGAGKEVIKTVNRVSFQFPETYVAMADAALQDRKLDAGEALRNKDAEEWVKFNTDLSNAINVKSPEFFKWQMMKI